MAVLETYGAQLEALNRQARLIQVSLEDTTRARESFKALVDAKEGDDILIPVGASSYIHAKATAKRTVIVGIGNRMSAEKELDEAIAFMDVTAGELSQALKDTIGTIAEIEEMADQLTLAVQNEYQQREQSAQ